MGLNKNLAIVVCLFIVVLISYANIFQNEFAWDDEFFIVENIHIRDIKNIPGFFIEPSPGFLYRPLRTVFYTINYRIWGLDTFGYHLNSLLLHFFVTVLFFFITSKITGKAGFSFVVALFFAAHPIHTERITNMTATFDVLTILFFLVSILLYINYSKKNKKKYYFLSIVAYLLAIFSTEEAITLILILFLYDFSFNYHFNLKNTILLLKKYVPYIVITIFYLVIRFSVVRQIGREEFYFENNLFGTLLTTAKIFVEYILILFVPVNLTIERVVKFETSFSSLSFLISFFILLTIFYFFIKSYKKSKIVFFSIGWFFITLSPFSNFVPQVTIMAERYLYLPSYGFCLFLAILIFNIDKINSVRKYSKAITIILVILITGMYAALTIQRNSEWKNDFILLSTAVEKYPLGTRTHHALALYYRNLGDYNSALKYASRAVELSSRNYNAYENLGTINAYQKNYGEAIHFYKKAIELNPDFYLALNNLGIVYSYIGDLNTSIFYLKKAIQANPTLSKAYNDIGTVYAQMGEFDIAIENIKKAIEINPYDSGYYYNLALIYEFLGEEDKAKDLLLKALELEPNGKKAKNKLHSLRR